VQISQVFLWLYSRGRPRPRQDGSRFRTATAKMATTDRIACRLAAAGSRRNLRLIPPVTLGEMFTASPTASSQAVSACPEALRRWADRLLRGGRHQGAPRQGHGTGGSQPHGHLGLQPRAWPMSSSPVLRGFAIRPAPSDADASSPGASAAPTSSPTMRPPPCVTNAPGVQYLRRRLHGASGQLDSRAFASSPVTPAIASCLEPSDGLCQSTPRAYVASRMC
jgi:hypothetical protein